MCGSYGYEESDAKDMASWGVDLLKYDYCGAPSDRATAIKRYTAMSKALKKTNRSVVFRFVNGEGVNLGYGLNLLVVTIGERQEILWIIGLGRNLTGIIDIVALNGRLAKYAGQEGGMIRICLSLGYRGGVKI